MPSDIAKKRQIVTLVILAVVILGAGVWLKPKQEVTQPAISATEIARLQLQLKRKSLEDISDYFTQLANDAASHVAFIKTVGNSGLAWNETGIVITATNFSAPFPPSVDVAMPDGQQVGATAVATYPGLPIAAVKAPLNKSLRSARRASQALRPGQWVLALARRPDGTHTFSVGLYSGRIPSRCGDLPFQQIVTSVNLTRQMLGGAVFDLDGSVLGVVANCGQRYAILAADSIDSALQQANSFPARMLRRYGLRLASLDERSSAYFRADHGVLVREVWKGYPADAAGVVPGDVIVGADDAPVRTMEDVQTWVSPEVPEVSEFRVLRKGKTLRLKLSALDTASAQPAVLLNRPADFLIRSIAPGSVFEQAGIRPGDRLLQIGGVKPHNLSQVEQKLSDSDHESIFVVVERPDRKVGLFLR